MMCRLIFKIVDTYSLISGQGGNNAIESAAALTNCLVDMMSSCQGSAPSLKEINHALNAYESNRRHRARDCCVSASLQTRLEAMNTFKDKLTARYLLTFGSEIILDQITNRLTGAVLVKALPFPERALEATLPYDIKAGVGYEESKKLRALLAIPLLGVAYYAHRTFSGQLSDLSQLTGLRNLYLLQDLIPLEIVWTIEGLRRANSITLPPLGPTLWTTVSQLLGLHVVVPVYNFFHFTMTPLEKLRALDQRMVPTGDAKVIIPAVGLGWLAPAVLLSLWPEAPSSAVKLLRFFPLWTAVAHRALKATVKDTSKRDRIHAPKSDLPFLRGAYLIAGCFSAAIYNYFRFFSPAVKGSGSTALLSLMTPECTSHIIICGSWFFWEALHFWDLKKARKTEFGMVKAFTSLAAGSILFGPAAALTFGWYWREEILASDKRPYPPPWPSTPMLGTEMTNQKELVQKALGADTPIVPDV